MVLAVVIGLNTAFPTVKAASGNVYYVAPGGSDSNPGTEDHPCRTIQHAWDSAQLYLHQISGLFTLTLQYEALPQGIMIIKG